MKAKDVKNLAASHRAKLLNRSRERREDFQFVLGRWMAERFLYRLGISAWRNQIVLKGATLFLIWKGELSRPTRDLDFLGYGPPDIPAVVESIREICSLPAEDGIQSDLNSIRGSAIREDAEYDGIRVLFEAVLDRARVTIQIDIGYGDVVDPDPEEAQIPVMLDLPPPTLRTYPLEVAIAEKFEAMVKLGIANSRMKDFFDIWTLSREQQFSKLRLRRALTATFAQRRTSLPNGAPTALTDAFLRNPDKARMWIAFIERIRWRPDESDFVDLATVGAAIAEFILPVLDGAEDLKWSPGGPWK